jgi:hypothetical protein
MIAALAYLAARAVEHHVDMLVLGKTRECRIPGVGLPDNLRPKTSRLKHAIPA